jgi:hypothetical protein
VSAATISGSIGVDVVINERLATVAFKVNNRFQNLVTPPDTLRLRLRLRLRPSSSSVAVSKPA